MPGRGMPGLAAGLALVAGAMSADAQPAIAGPNFAPDNQTGWVPARAAGDEFIAPERGVGPVTAEKGHAYIPNRAGQPTYRIADLSNPNLKPWVADWLKIANDRVRAGQVPYVPHERCWPAGVPGWEVYTRVRPVYFIQTPQKVTIVDELNYEVRHIYLNVPHSKDLKPSWYGESVGHYEGDELVIDTIGLNDKAPVDNYGTPHTAGIHVIERLKLIDGGRILQATVMVTDPGAFNAPWTAVQRWKRGDHRALEEDACAENNYSFLGYDVMPIPEATRADF